MAKFNGTQITRVGLLGKPSHPETVDTITLVSSLLAEWQIDYTLTDDSALAEVPGPKRPLDALLQTVELLIVIGGDGSLLKAARMASPLNIPVIGINRGRRGFLTDIHPETVKTELRAIFDGQGFVEERALLSLSVSRQGNIIHSALALNDVVVNAGEFTRMIELTAHVDGALVYEHRSDGLIVATPTGSTAYALSGGGPILQPSLDALVLVPMHPHTLASRPMVIKEDAVISVEVTPNNPSWLKVTCDGQIHAKVEAGDVLHIQKAPNPLKLVHPTDYNYFETLRAKLGWG